MKTTVSAAIALGLAAIALVGQAAVDTGDAGGSLVSVQIFSDFKIVNNTTSPAPAQSNIAAGTLRYNCGGTLPLKDLAKGQSADIECAPTSIIYQVPGEIGPFRLDFSCQVGETQQFTFTGSGRGVTATPRCLAAPT